MIVSYKSIWDFYNSNNYIVITTNIGWKSNGENPMGAGIAKMAKMVDRNLPLWYGDRCKRYLSETAVCIYEPARFILFPTKPLNEKKPSLSWQSKSSVDLITRFTIQLAKLQEMLDIPNIGLPVPGTNNGGLSPDDIVPILEKYLNNSFILFV